MAASAAHVAALFSPILLPRVKLVSPLSRAHGKAFVRFRSFASQMASSEPSKESPSLNPGLCSKPDEATKGYFLQQTMFRVKDPKVSLDFYSRVLGMNLLKRLDFPEMKFSLYFLGYENPESAPTDPVQRTVWTFSQKATLELTHNWGTENDPEFKGYHNGNSEPRGFGHIGITVDDTYKACERFERLGVEFVKRPDDALSGLSDNDDVDEDTCSCLLLLPTAPTTLLAPDWLLLQMRLTCCCYRCLLICFAAPRLLYCFRCALTCLLILQIADSEGVLCSTTCCCA